MCPSSCRFRSGFSVFGKHINGIAIRMVAKPRTINPSHHAPMNLGSFGPMSTSINDKVYTVIIEAFVDALNGVDIPLEESLVMISRQKKKKSMCHRSNS